MRERLKIHKKGKICKTNYFNPWYLQFLHLNLSTVLQSKLTFLELVHFLVESISGEFQSLFSSPCSCGICTGKYDKKNTGEDELLYHQTHGFTRKYSQNVNQRPCGLPGELYHWNVILLPTFLIHLVSVSPKIPGLTNIIYISACAFTFQL